jgi:DNA-binding FadR family transcriptional regulator
LIDNSAERLRELALAAPDGALIGSEDEIVDMLGASRVTVRQAARLLEREGVLTVKRGKKGGYFAARPSIEAVSAVIGAYLETLGIHPKHTSEVSTALWVEALRQAALADRATARIVCEKLRRRIESVDPDVSALEMGQLERENRAAIFDLIGGAYIAFIIHFNTAFASQHFASVPEPLDRENHREFVRQWKQAKLFECEAILSGDPTQAVLAAMHDRSVWHNRGKHFYNEPLE